MKTCLVTIKMFIEETFEKRRILRTPPATKLISLSIHLLGWSKEKKNKNYKCFVKLSLIFVRMSLWTY